MGRAAAAKNTASARVISVMGGSTGDISYPQCEKRAGGLSRGRGILFAPEVGEQPQAGELPPPGGRRRGGAEGVCRLGPRQAGEGTQFAQFRLDRFGRRG